MDGISNNQSGAKQYFCCHFKYSLAIGLQQINRNQKVMPVWSFTFAPHGGVIREATGEALHTEGFAMWPVI